MNVVLSQPWVQRLGWTLIQFLWQGTVVSVGFAILRALFGRALSTQGRYVLACCSMAAMTVLPVLTFLSQPASGDVAGPVTPWPLSSSDAWQGVLPWLALAWVAGAAVFTMRFVSGWVSSVRLRKTSVVPLPAEWAACLEDLIVRLRVSRPVQFLQSSIVDAPMMIGWLRPVVLIPAAALTGLPPEYIRALLAHELAHVRRFDYLINILQSVAEAALFYHPGVWWISDQIRAEREACCDDMAVAATGDVLVYARALAELESQRGGFRGVMVAADGGRLLGRIRRLVQPSAPDHSIPGPAAAAVVSILWLIGMGSVVAHGSPAKQTTVSPVLQTLSQPAPAQIALNRGSRVPPLLLSPFGPQAPPAQAPAKPARAVLSGVVVEDQSGSTAASVAVSVYKSGSTGEAAEFETDSSGRFGGVDLPSGDYRLEFSKSNFITATRQVSLGGPQNLTVRLIRFGAVTGTVTDMQGQPVPGVVIAAVPKPPNGEPLRAERGALHAASSDARGKYRVYGLPPGDYAIVMTYGGARNVAPAAVETSFPARLGSGFQFYPSNTRPDFLTIVSGSEQRGIDFKLPDQGLFNVMGTVESTGPASRFGIALLRADQSDVAISTRTVAPGMEFRFTGIPPGSYRLVASRLGLPTGLPPNLVMQPNGMISQLPPGAQAPPSPEPVYAEARVEVAGKDSERITLRPSPGRTAKFALTTVTGCPDNVQLMLIPRDEWGPDGRKQANLTDGQVLTVTGLAPGAYSVRVGVGAVDPACFGPPAMSLDLSGRDSETPVAVAIGHAGSIKGTLEAGSQSPEEFAVMLTPTDGSPAEVVTAGARGQFSFQNVRPGSYRIGAYRSNRAVPAVTPTIDIQVMPESSLDMTLSVPGDVK